MATAEPVGTALFLKRWLRRPFAMGAVVPSGRLLAAAVARRTVAEIAGREGRPTGWRWSSETRNWSRSCAGIFADPRSSRATPRA